MFKARNPDHEVDIFANLTSTQGASDTMAVCKDKEMGLSYVFYFSTPVGHWGDHEHAAQVLSRVFAVLPHRMVGRDPSRWSDSLRWELVAAEQHLPIPILQSIADI